MPFTKFLGCVLCFIRKEISFWGQRTGIVKYCMYPYVVPHPKGLSPDSKKQQNFEVLKTWTLKNWYIVSIFFFHMGRGPKTCCFYQPWILTILSAYLVGRWIPLSLFYGPSLILVKWRAGPHRPATPLSGRKYSQAISWTAAGGPSSDREWNAQAGAGSSPGPILRSLATSFHSARDDSLPYQPSNWLLWSTHFHIRRSMNCTSVSMLKGKMHWLDSAFTSQFCPLQAEYVTLLGPWVTILMRLSFLICKQCPT